MAFMNPQACDGPWVVVEEDGTTVIPLDVVGIDLDTAEGLDLDGWRGHLRDYVQDTDRVSEVEVKDGWCARLSASGYLDCTDWTGPYATEAEALEALAEMYPDEEG